MKKHEPNKNKMSYTLLESSQYLLIKVEIRSLSIPKTPQQLLPVEIKY